MDFARHSGLEGKHAFLGASDYHWLNYDAEKMLAKYQAIQAKERGTKLHSLAASCIRLGVYLRDSSDTLNMYVNDILGEIDSGFPFRVEQPLVYSEFCFGTADAIGFDDGVLKIYDLKTGSIRASIKQLYIYAALFFLEYSHLNPYSVQTELRIYQNNDTVGEIVDPKDLEDIMDKIVLFDRTIRTYIHTAAWR